VTVPAEEVLEPDPGTLKFITPPGELLVLRYDATKWATLDDVAAERIDEDTRRGTDQPMPDDALPSGWPWPQS
jgi:hypothetical protein